MKRIAILGSTGSIGSQALEVAQWRNYEVTGLAAGCNVEKLLEQVSIFKPRVASCAPQVEAELRARLPEGTELIPGRLGQEAVACSDAEVIVAAIPGIAGLDATVAAVKTGRRVALAHKEAMVVAGPLIRTLAAARNTEILPVDSEHSALFQSLLGEPPGGVDTLVLTASGGPFLDGPETLAEVSPEQALRHPNWSMGARITIDSATLFNKGLEVLEAHFLFDTPLENIEVVIHPQSLVHGMVRFKDGSIKAQLGPHDMRPVIQYAIEYPDRPATPLEPLPLRGSWSFLAPDTTRFPALALAYEAGRRGGVAPALLNAADELAVAAFLNGRIGFTAIPEVLEYALERGPVAELSWDSLGPSDDAARRLAAEAVSKLSL